MQQTGLTEPYPRVLFLTSAAFNKVTGGGVTFSNLFRDWPRDHIATVHNDTVPVTTDVCERYYRLGEAEIHRRGVWRRLLPVVGQTSVDVSDAPACPSLLRRMARLGRRVLFGNGLSDTGLLTPELERWVEEFRPQVLYTILGTNGMMELANALRRRFNLALVVHIMDDWPAVAYRGGLLSGPTRRYMDRLLHQLLLAAAGRLCISDAMASEYRQRYGVPFDVFQNPVDTGTWAAFGKTDIAVGLPARIAYIGSILEEAQLTSVVDCCRAVAALRRRGIDVVFHIYSPAYQTAVHRSRLVFDEAVCLHDAVTDDAEVFRLLGAADVLLLPVNFDAATIRYVRLSMPTKVPAFLFSGTPVLVYAPEALAQTEYARRAGWGLVIDRREEAALMHGIERLLTDMLLREQLSRAARSTAHEHHDSARVRTRFQVLLRQASQNMVSANEAKRGEVV